MRASPRPRFGATFAWLALFALLSNAVLPAVVMAAAGAFGADYGNFRLGLCRASPTTDVPGKAKPAMPVHRCMLCTPAPDVTPPDRQAALTRSCEIVGEAFPVTGTTLRGARWRNYRTQPRAPPAAA
jgi:hypothetical protein